MTCTKMSTVLNTYLLNPYLLPRAFLWELVHTEARANPTSFCGNGGACRCERAVNGGSGCERKECGLMS